jgi:catechol 2,3-dioxygenase-like lactoylglutathione lyase family enzyme
MRMSARIRVPETNGEFAVVKSEGSDHTLEINWYENQEYKAGDELDHIAFQVVDLDEALTELKSKGIEPISSIIETEHSRRTFIIDPDGIWIEVFQKLSIR